MVHMCVQLPNHQIPKLPSTRHIPTHSTYGTKKISLILLHPPQYKVSQSPVNCSPNFLIAHSSKFQLLILVFVHLHQHLPNPTTCSTAPLCLFPSPPPPPPSPTKSCCAEIFLFVPVPEFSDRRQAVCPTGGRPVITSNLFKPLLSHLEFDTNTK